MADFLFAVYGMGNFVWPKLGVLNYNLTSVGHEDLQTRVVQQVASGKHGSDLAEHPLAVQTLRVGLHLVHTMRTLRHKHVKDAS